MKRILIIAVAAFATSTLAQQPAQPSPEEVTALLQAVAAQRDAQANMVAQLSAKLTVMQAELEKAKATACKPKSESK